MTDSPYNRLAGCIEESTKCIASDYMMWKWISVLTNPECVENGLIECRYSESTTSGYCGLRGK